MTIIFSYLFYGNTAYTKDISIEHLFAPWTDIQQVHQENHHITTSQDRYEIIKKNKTIIDALCHNNDAIRNNTAQITLANNLVEWAFSPSSAAMFMDMHTNATQYPILQLLYTAMWSILSEKGWFDWHSNCMQSLKLEHDAGKTIVYVGGGCDVYQLITHGIYNITIIDPMLPTQERYYVKDYHFLLQGVGPNNGINDTITHENLTLKRSDFQIMPGYITVALPSGQQRCIPTAKTTWSVFDEKQKRLGSIVFERRLATQKDFELKNALLVSWNELYYIINGSWGIKLDQLSTDTKLFVKQLRKPITKEFINNMHQADLLNRSTFQFIGLGSNVT